MARNGKNDQSVGLDRIIRHRLADEREAGGAQCPDTSIIAAYCERALSLEERSLWERHFAECARCAGTIAAFARIVDTAETAGSRPAASIAWDARRSWKLHGSFPIVAFGATVAVLALIVIRTLTTEHSPIDLRAKAGSSSQQIASNTAAADATTRIAKSSRDDRLAIAMNKAAPAKPAPTPSFQSFAKDALSPAEVPAPVSSEARRPARDELFDEKSRVDKLKERNAEIANSPAPTPPDLAVAGPAANAPSAPTTRSPGEVGDSSAGLAGPIGSVRLPAHAEAPALSSPPGSIESDGGGGNAACPSARVRESTDVAGIAIGDALAVGPGKGSTARAGRGATSIAIKPPDHSVVWMIGAHGAISHYSHIAGWTLQASGVGADLVAGSAPSASICWIVGHAGTILRTLDGLHWSKINTPVSDDLSSVIAVSATNATISAAAGRRFSTSDGGATWRPL